MAGGGGRGSFGTKRPPVQTRPPRGEYQAARELGEDTLDRRRRVLGDDHPDTMASAASALILSGLVADPKAREAMETMKAAWSQRGEGREPGS